MYETLINTFYILIGEGIGFITILLLYILNFLVYPKFLIYCLKTMSDQNKPLIFIINLILKTIHFPFKLHEILPLFIINFFLLGQDMTYSNETHIFL